ncbi:MAG: enoyl-CoA hydratase/isomerase family protein [Thalassobaculales bacterium]
MTDEIQFERRGGIGLVTLNRPRALNALTLAMIEAMSPQLDAWAADPAVHAVVVRGAGERAFCAGGDVRAVYDSVKTTPSDLHRVFFAAEYRLNRQIHRYPKPYIALIDGVTMGGGVGLSIHGAFRVASERTLVAMPETGIGLFPDVGGTWFLPRMPGWLGTWAGLTGARLGPADAVYCGFATHYVPSAKLPALEAALADADWAAAPAHDVARRAIQSLAEGAGLPPAAAWRSRIDDCFRRDSLEAVLAALAAGDEWCRGQRDAIASKSPTALAMTFEQLRRGRLIASIEEALVLEYRLTQACMAGHDFFEGIRALLVDKDQSPKWRPASLAEVDPAAIARAFDPLPNDLTF